MHSAVDRLSINQKKFLFSWKKITILDDGAETRDSEISGGDVVVAPRVVVKYTKCNKN